MSPAQQAAIAISKKEKEQKENNYIHAAKMAKEKGEKTFTIGGKEYDVEETLKTEKLVSEKKANFIRLSFNNPADVKKAKKWMDANLPGADQGFTGMDASGKDIDNDGDVDASDKFLHKRRKAVSKSMKEDTVADAVRAMWEAAAKKADAKTEEEDEDEKPSKDSKGDTTMTGKPMSKVEVAVKEKG